MKIYHLQILLISVLILASEYTRAQKLGIPEIEFFNRRQYEAGTQNWNIDQSKAELLYFANNQGVLEYDGVRWTTYNDMGQFAVRCVKCVDDRVYAGGFNEIGYFKYDSIGNFNYTSLANSQKLEGIGEFWKIHKFGSKIIFTAEKAICIVENDVVTTVIKAPVRFVASFNVNGMILVHDLSKGLMELRGNKIYPLSGGRILIGKDVNSIMPLSDNEVVIGTMKNGLYIWDMESIKPWNVQANNILIEANIFCATLFEDKYLIFGTIQKGFVITDMKGNLLMQFGKDKGLINNTVLSVFVDREGNIWAGLDNGIARVNLKSGMSFISGYYDIGTGYIMNKFEDTYYLGTNQALFSINSLDFNYPLKGRQHFKRVTGTDGQVWNLFNDDDEILCGHDRGVMSIKGSNSEIITPPAVNGVWIFRKTPINDNLMVCGTYNGLILLEKINNKWTYKWSIDGFDESARFMEWDEKGSLWIVHDQKGLYQITLSNDFKTAVDVNKIAYSDFSESTSCTLTKIDNQLLISGYDGFYTITQDNSIIPYTAYNAFFNHGGFPNKIKQDQYNNIWYAINNRVGVLYLHEDGSYKKIEYPFLPIKQKVVSAFESFYVQDRENVFFGIEDGFAHYHTGSYQNYQMPFNVHLRSFSERSDSIVYQLHQSDDNKTKQIIIPEYEFKNNAFTIHYASTFYKENDLLYSSYLTGVDEGFTDWTSVTFRQLTKLKEGNYTFTVRAKNRYDVQTLPITFKFRVLPPWYRHPYAKVAYIALVLITALIVILIFNRRIEVSKKKEKLKERERYKEREEKLTSEALRAEKEMIKMRNDKLRSEMGFKEKELAGLTVHIMQKNELLTELQNQLNRIKKIRQHDEAERKINNLIKKIGKDIDNESNWQMFEKQFEQVHQSFLNRLTEKYKDLTEKEKKLCAYIKIGMTSKEIASLMNINTRSVENNRYKLRQKLGLSSGDDLSKYISSL